MQHRPIIVAVDGPAGSGKSSVCAALAQQLQWTYVNTGAIYRAVSLVALEKGARVDEEDSLAEVVSSIVRDIVWDAKTCRLYFAGNDLTDRLHTAEVGKGASFIARLPKVRARLLDLQRRLALQAERGAIVDGRDIGTVIFPDADLKIFLTASLEERARRRSLQLVTTNADINEIRGDIAARDQQDQKRETAPLKMAIDAIEVDTTGISLEQVVNKIIDLLKEKSLVI